MVSPMLVSSDYASALCVHVIRLPHVCGQWLSPADSSCSSSRKPLR